MKKHLIAGLFLASLSGSAFALPGVEQPPLTELRPTSAAPAMSAGAN